MIANDQEDRAIADLRTWLDEHAAGTLPPPNRLAAQYQLSLVCVMDEVRAAKKRLRRPVNQFTVVTSEPEPDPSERGEAAFTAHLDAGDICDTDTVHTLARRFGLSYVYVRTELAGRRITVPMMHRRPA